MARIPWPFGRDSEESPGGMQKEMLKPFAVHELRRRSDPQRFEFQTTDELQPIEGLIGQEWALEAIRFGTRISSPGYNLFALGLSGSGRHTAIRKLVEKTAASAPAPDDWVYVNNFADAHKPKALRLPPGIALRLRDAMQDLIDDLRTALPATFESDEYRNRRRAIEKSLEDAQENAFEELRKKAEAEQVGILRTPMGLSLAPIQDGNVIKPEVFNALPLEQRQQIEAKIAELQKELEEVLRHVPLIQKEYRAKLRTLNTEVAELTDEISIGEVSAQFSHIAPIQDYLAGAKRDLIDNVGIFLETEDEAARIEARAVEKSRNVKQVSFRRLFSWRADELEAAFLDLRPGFVVANLQGEPFTNDETASAVIRSAGAPVLLIRTEKPA